MIPYLNLAVSVAILLFAWFIASGDPAALVALSADLDAKQAELAAAITANTPSAPAARK